MKRVGLFTTFFESESGYSLISVAETQLNMLLRGGYDPVVLVQENWQEPKSEQSVWKPEVVDLRPIIPFLNLSDGADKDFENRTQKILDALRAGLKDVDVCITHDIILQKVYKEHNIAMRRYAAERPDLLWLHWIHSCPTPGNAKYPGDCRYKSPPGYIIYPNASDKARVCQTYKLAGKEWKVKVSRTSHSIDPLLFGEYDKLTKSLVEASGLLAADISAVYPVRLDRGKQPEKIIRLMAGIQRAGKDPRLLIVDWQSMGKRFQEYIDELQALAENLGLNGKVFFTSRLDDRCNNGVSRKVVGQLMDLSNVYIHPSRIETYSLTAHEAILKGCLTVLNHDLPVMRELFGESAIYMDFESDRINRKYEPNEQTFWNEEALRLISELTQNRSLMGRTKARQQWTPGAMWQHFEPLLYLAPVGE